MFPDFVHDPPTLSSYLQVGCQQGRKINPVYHLTKTNERKYKTQCLAETGYVTVNGGMQIQMNFKTLNHISFYVRGKG